MGIEIQSQKLLKFTLKGKLYQFPCMANGLSPAPRIYTKLLKTIFAAIRKVGHSNVPHINDSLLQSDTKDTCSENVNNTVTDDLGLTIHPGK